MLNNFFRTLMSDTKPRNNYELPMLIHVDRKTLIPGSSATSRTTAHMSVHASFTPAFCVRKVLTFGVVDVPISCL